MRDGLNTPQDLLASIAALPLRGPVRVLNLSDDQERVIAFSGMRRALPSEIQLLAGPGCAASLCPQAELYQAIQLAVRHPLTLLTTASMLRMPVSRHLPGPHSLAEAMRQGADVRTVGAPVEALLAARAAPGRPMVLLIAGFETLLAPLAGMILDGLPPNLSLLLCGRRVDPLLERLLTQGGHGFDALLLPGNRCSVTGIESWRCLVERFRVPAAVAGYTVAGILSALYGLLRQTGSGKAHLENCYQGLVHPGGSGLALDRLEQVFEHAEGQWRGVGPVAASAFRLRAAYREIDADVRWPDYRCEAGPETEAMPPGCDCGAVLLGLREPTDCRHFAEDCRSVLPYGPCMAAEEGTCSLRSGYPLGG